MWSGSSLAALPNYAAYVLIEVGNWQRLCMTSVGMAVCRAIGRRNAFHFGQVPQALELFLFRWNRLDR